MANETTQSEAKTVAAIGGVNDVFPFTGDTLNRSLRPVFSGPDGQRDQIVKVAASQTYVGTRVDICTEISGDATYLFRFVQIIVSFFHEKPIIQKLNIVVTLRYSMLLRKTIK